MRRIVRAAVLAAVIAGCGSGGAEAASLAAAAFANTGRLAVNCPAIGKDGVIPPRYSAKGGNLSPPIDWSPAPGAKSYAVVVQDPDAPGPAPFVHWLIWNIPGAVTALSPGAAPEGAVQGRNGAGGVGYHGPGPPPGRPHHYYFQVFALSSTLPAPPGSEIAAALGAMKGRVIAKGQCVGTFQSRP